MNEKRKLIKFSNYSLCVTLPKSVITNLKWKKGDTVQMSVDEKKKTITIFKGKINKSGNQDKETKKAQKSNKTARW